LKPCGFRLLPDRKHRPSRAVAKSEFALATFAMSGKGKGKRQQLQLLRGMAPSLSELKK